MIEEIHKINLFLIYFLFSLLGAKILKQNMEWFYNLGSLVSMNTLILSM